MLHCTEDFRLKKMAGLVTGHDVLDIGFAQTPNVYIEAQNLIGLDLVRTNTPSNYAATYQGNAFDLPRPFPTASFDTVLAGEVLEHVRDPIGFLEKMHETLKPGGKLILSTPNPLFPPEVICNIFLNRGILYCEEHITLYPQRWLLRILDLAGFYNARLFSGGIQFPFVGKGKFPRIGLIPFPRAFCYQTIAIADKSGPK